MIVSLTYECHQIKAGWAAHSPLFRLAAHGYSREVALINLERVVRMMWRPFDREGTLAVELQALGDLQGVGVDDITINWKQVESAP